MPGGTKLQQQTRKLETDNSGYGAPCESRLDNRLPQVNIDQFPGFGSARESGLRGHIFDILWMADKVVIFQRLQGWPPCCRG